MLRGDGEDGGLGLSAARDTSNGAYGANRVGEGLGVKVKTARNHRWRWARREKLERTRGLGWFGQLQV
jgi:hypothetical protein